MKATFVLFSALAALGAATPAPSNDMIARGLSLVQKQQGCHECIDDCKQIGGLGEAACKILVCAIECVLLDNDFEYEGEE